MHPFRAGLIDEFTVMLRPLKAVNAFADKTAVEFATAMQEQGPTGPGAGLDAVRALIRLHRDGVDATAEDEQHTPAVPPAR